MRLINPPIPAQSPRRELSFLANPASAYPRTALRTTARPDSGSFAGVEHAGEIIERRIGIRTAPV